MANISRLVVEITSKDSKFRRGISNASRKMADFAKKAAKSAALIGGVITGVAAVAFTKLIGSINESADAIDNLAKTSAKLGIATDALQRMQYQANLTGVSTQTLNMALQRMVRRVAEAAKGTGEAKDALKELGIDAAQLVRLSPDKQFASIAKAMQSVENQADKVRLAMKLFDSEGVALVNTLNSNLEETGKEFDSLGVAISNQQAKAVEAYNDAATKLSTIWDGFLKQLTVQAAPAFQMIIEHITDVIKNMGGMQNAARVVADGIIGGVNFMISAFRALLTVINSVETGLKRLEIGFLKAKQFAQAVKGSLFISRQGETLGNEAGVAAASQVLKAENELNNLFASGGVAGGLDKQLGALQNTLKQSQQQLRGKIDIKVSAERGAVVEDVLTSGELQAAVENTARAFTRNESRINDR